MNKMKFYIVIFLMLLPVMVMTLPTTQAAEGNPEFTKVDGVYNIRIEASQWEFKAFDLNAHPDVPSMTVEEKTAYEVKHRIELPDATAGDKLVFSLVSKDVQHGFSINELEMAIALNRPEGGQIFGEPTTAEATLDADTIGQSGVDTLSDDNTGNGGGLTYSAFCHIFCGLGHPDMKIKLVIGGGALELGPYVFYGALVMNTLIFGLTLRSILTKISAIPA